MALRIAALAIAGLFALLALLALSQAIVIGLFHVVPPGVAWLLAALCYLIIAGLIVLLVRLRKTPKRATDPAGLMKLIGEQIEQKPARSLLMALIAGALYEQLNRRSK